MSKKMNELEVRRHARTEEHARVLEEQLTATRAELAALKAAPAPPPVAPVASKPEPTKLETYREMKKGPNPYQAAQFLLNNQAEILREAAAERAK